MKVDFTKPLGVFMNGEHDTRYKIRVIATDRVCPSNKYHYVILAYNEGAMFGPEEFAWVAAEDGSVGGQGLSWRDSVRNIDS